MAESGDQTRSSELRAFTLLMPADGLAGRTVPKLPPWLLSISMETEELCPQGNKVLCCLLWEQRPGLDSDRAARVALFLVVEPYFVTA